MSKVIDNSESVFNVFVTPSGQYVAVRPKGLAFGNMSKEIYLVDSLCYAQHFYSHVTELNPDHYYHEFSSVLKMLINSLKVKQVLAKTEYSFVEEKQNG